MSGKYMKKSSKAPVIIIIALIIAAILAGVIVTAYVLKGNDSDSAKDTHTASSSLQESTEASSRSGAVQNTSLNVSENREEESEEGQSEGINSQNTTEKVVVPDGDNNENLYFDAVFTPYKAVDAETDGAVSLREVFGSSYSGGTFVFVSDGTFTDNLSISSVNSGAYAVDENSIRATYTNDKNITVGIIEYDGDIPSEIVINYGGYDVYFSK